MACKFAFAEPVLRVLPRRLLEIKIRFRRILECVVCSMTSIWWWRYLALLQWRWAVPSVSHCYSRSAGQLDAQLASQWALTHAFLKTRSVQYESASKLRISGTYLSSWIGDANILRIFSRGWKFCIIQQPMRRKKACVSLTQLGCFQDTIFE